MEQLVVLPAALLKTYETVPGLYLVLSPDLMVLTASDAYLAAQGLNREELKGRSFLDLFPQDPLIPFEMGFSASLQRVLDTLEPHQLPLLKLELPDPSDQEVTISKYWDVTHTPFLDENGAIQYIIQYSFDVSNLISARKKSEQREKKIAASEKHLEFLLNAMPQQVWTATAHGIINYVNEICCRDFGKTVEELRGLGWQSFVHPDDLPACIRAWSYALGQNSEYSVEFRLQMADGQYKWYLGKAIPLIESGELKMWMGTNTNIDVQKSNEQRKDEFLAIASHELKTPLTSIKAFNQLMKKTNDPEKLHGFVEKSASNIFRLEQLIADLLDVTKINSGSMSFDKEAFNFNEIIEAAMHTVQAVSPDHELFLEHSIAILYHGDRLRIEQVLVNFLSNAVKYSPNGGKVILKGKIQADNIVISVQDFGIGIADFEMKRLFERYYRVDNEDLRYEGLGLGLFICSEILKAHQGSFWLESELDAGSTFYFRLPLKAHVAVDCPVERHHFYQDDSLTVSYNKEHHRLDAKWKGFNSKETVQHGAMVMLALLRANECHKILNDNREVLGTWSDASDWVGETWFPMIEKAGLTHFSWINSPDIFCRFSAEKSASIALGNVEIQFFAEIQSAEDWINRQ
ncbi:PAS domain-containing sensor histidine kinase [Pedobacter gandavensis]|uniref:histidine kinase n=1 Tax=Pedobacter gandavensis TaxID=2679963 RepID=A0ABR6ETY0_9SPHI|nr:ATP-binding protein [Pedobacter gandavensis]MBB2148716.1 PAS domain-containing protein [Pedobacter gandavensis]